LNPNLCPQKENRGLFDIREGHKESMMKKML